MADVRSLATSLPTDVPGHISWVPDLHSAVLQANIADSCHCKCSKGGCTPITFLLKAAVMINYASGAKVNCFAEGIIHWRESMAISHPLPSIATFTQYLLDFGGNLGAEHHTAMLRYLIYTALDIPHTCCDPYDSNGSKGRSREEAADVENEHAYELAHLEKLLGEFEGELVTILQDPREEIARLIGFWERTWPRRMQEVLRGLEGSDLGLDERKGAEKIGVV